MSTITDSSVKPTFVMNSDARFATSFLSTKYRDKAVAGEALMDKTTGELYIKRVSDGKIVSFYQNKKMINDLALEFRVLLLNNRSFVYPSTSETAFYVSTNYDLISINNESLYNLKTDNITITGEPNDINKLTFKLSGGSNGFFCRCCTRDIDKPFVEYSATQYNSIIKNYTGSDESYLTEYMKFDESDKWEGSDAVLTYDITTTKNGVEQTFTDIVDYIRLNDNCTVFLPNTVYTGVDSFDSAVVTIKSITFDKLHFMVSPMDEFDASAVEIINGLMPNDNRIEIGEFIISHFINEARDFIALGNETIIAFITAKHMTEYMDQLYKLIEPETLTIEIAEEQPQPKHVCLWFKPIE